MRERERGSREPRDVRSWNNGSPGETGAPSGEGEDWEKQMRICSAAEYSVEQVFSAVFTIPSHSASLIDKVSPYLFFCGTWASHCCGLSRCRAQAPDAQAQRPWLTGLAAARHVGSSRTGARTRVPCIGRRTLNHCATREARFFIFICRCSL